MTPLPKPTPKPYTRKPGSTAGTRRMRYDIPMKSGEYLRWLNKKRPVAAAPIPLAAGDLIWAIGEGAGGSEIDDGYLGAIRLAPRVVGNEDGQVPLAVALRLVARGVIARV